MEPGPGGFTAVGRALFFYLYQNGTGKMLRADVPFSFRKAERLRAGHIII